MQPAAGHNWNGQGVPVDSRIRYESAYQTGMQRLLKACNASISEYDTSWRLVELHHFAAANLSLQEWKEIDCNAPNSDI